MTAFVTTSSDPSDRDNAATPSSSVRSRGLDLAINVGLLSALWVAYGVVRSMTADDFGTAMSNAGDLLHFQSVVGLPSELGIQRGLLGRTGLLRAANVYYFAIHFPATVMFLSWVWLRHRERFTRIRNTLIAVTGCGLVVHIVYPLAPPRMVDGFVDTAVIIGPNPYDLKIAAVANQIAAMPSLHVGWALILALGVMSIVSKPWRHLALAHPVVTAVVVVVTANHYWTDAIVAATLVLLTWAAATRIGGRRCSSGNPGDADLAVDGVSERSDSEFGNQEHRCIVS